MTAEKRKKPSCDSSPVSCTSDCSSRCQLPPTTISTAFPSTLRQVNSHAIGSRAQSASEVVPSEPPRRERANTSAKSRKGKGKVSSSRAPTLTNIPVHGNDDDVYYVPPILGTVGGKRSVSSLGTNGEPEGTRRSKLTRSSTGLEDAISKIENYSNFVLEDRRSRMEFESLYSVMQCQDVISTMEIPDN